MLENKQRNVSLDILKIICMVMVVILHINLYGMKNVDVSIFSGVYFGINIARTLSIVAVNCFVLCSGFFLCDKDIRSKKIFSLWLQVLSYSVILYLCLCMFDIEGVKFGIKKIIVQGLPLFTNQYWFFTCYVLMCIIAPVLNKFINSIDKKTFRRYLMILILFFSVGANFNIFGDPFEIKAGYSMVWFIILYLIAAYLKKYPIKKYSYKTYGRSYIGFCFFILLIKVVLDYLGDRIPKIYTVNKLYSYNSPFVLGASISLFLYFLHLTIDKSKAIEKLIIEVSSLSFGVYLLHEHNYIREILWSKLFDCSPMGKNFIFFILGSIFIILGIFVSGILLEKVRRIIFSFLSSSARRFKKR